jgi:hypothetical protein
MNGKTGFTPEHIRHYGDELLFNAKAQRTTNKGRKGKAARKEGRTIFRDVFSLRPCFSLCAFALNF